MKLILLCNDFHVNIFSREFLDERMLKDFFHCWSNIWVLIEEEGDKVVHILASSCDVSMGFLGYFLFKNLFGFFLVFLVCVEWVLEGRHKVKNDSPRPYVNFILPKILIIALRCFVQWGCSYLASHRKRLSAA